MSAPVISTTVLNWNRAELLRLTLDSYLATVTVPHELFIVDNGSTDGSRDVIAAFCEAHPEVVPILLDENEGGAAVNQGLERSKGEFMLISENDLEYLPGWDERALDFFECFPDLGQLSVYGPTTTDEEVLRQRSVGSLHHARGRVLYECGYNVCTSSIIRREVLEAGIRMRNMPSDGSFLFPDDGKFSKDIREAGWLVAWADHPLVGAVGFYTDELASNDEYYAENYRSKRVGVEEYRARLERSQGRPIPLRSSFLFPEQDLSPEMSAPSDECPEPHLWSMLDAWTPTVEGLEFVYALARATKPHLMLDSRAWRGFMTAAMARAATDNGRGHVLSVRREDDDEGVAQERLDEMGLADTVSLIEAGAPVPSDDVPIDLAYVHPSVGLPAFLQEWGDRLAVSALLIVDGGGPEEPVAPPGLDLEIHAIPCPKGTAVYRLVVE